MAENKWGVVVKIRSKREFKKFPTKEEAINYYAKAIQLEEKDRRIKVGLVSLVDPIPVAKDKKGKDGELWCPYCGEYRKFKSNDGYRRCEMCGVSEESFWVKTYNKLWPSLRKKDGGG